MKKKHGIVTAIVASLEGLTKGASSVSLEKKKTGRQIIVSSDCQTGGIAAALRIIFPNDEITPLTLPSSSKLKAQSKFAEKLKIADVWVSSGGYKLLETMTWDHPLQLIRIPVISFAGFHPDIVYARKASTHELVYPHYNSAIAVWAYRNRMEAQEAEKLFNKKTFIELGYLDQWGPSAERLQQAFKDSDLEFSDFFLAMRREGLFMYSLNHPKVIALVRLAKLVAQKLGAGPEVLDRAIDINEGLHEEIWPVYPGIGESLSLHSSYEWKMGEGRWLHGVRAFLENAFENYARLKISPEDLVAKEINQALYDHVLGAQTRRSLHDQPL